MPPEQQYPEPSSTTTTPLWDSRPFVATLLSLRSLCVILTLVSIGFGIVMGVLPSNWGGYGSDYGGLQLPVLSIVFLAIMLVLDTEEIIRLIIRQRLNHQRWQAYPGLIICCDLLVSLAVICTTFGFVYAQNSQYVWAVVHVATGGSSGVLHLLLSLSGCVYCCNFNRKKSMPPGNRASPLRGPWDNAPLRR